MLRFVLPVLLLLPFALAAQEGGRTEVFWKDYLSQTVRRGLPLLNTDPGPEVPFWPELDRLRTDAASLEPGPDELLLSSWVDLQEGRSFAAAKTLREGWPRPGLSLLTPRLWGEALFASWEPGRDPEAWTQAWLAWEDKAYSPRVLARGIETLEKTDPSAVVPLLKQAVALYPEDRRFLPLVARHPEVVVSAEGLVARDLAATGGWSVPTLRAILTRAPGTRELLLRAGYPAARVDAALARDYGTWLASNPGTPPADGLWQWDAGQTGRPESALSFESGRLTTWTRREADGGLWTLGFAKGKPDTLNETREGASWTLRYESYPWVRTLEYRWGHKLIVYRFPPLAQAVPLWPSERFSAPLERLPSALASLWLPLDPRALALGAASVETWEGSVRTQTVYLYQGEVWLSVADTDRDGRDDTWSYYRSGQLASVYHDVEGRGQANLRELYRKGELAQVQSRTTPGPRAQFVLFPAEGVQLWDPHGTGRPLDRIFVWSGQERLDALVFSGNSLPWETMPTWEPRP